jgi:D-serine deaminase-like pyridoxal phosphate-dependent protein
MKDSPLVDLDTPSAVIDLHRVHENLDRIAGYCTEHGLAWRPHVKTHKTPQIAVAQMQAGACGLTVATLREAEVMTAVAKDLLLAYPPVGAQKRRRLTELLRTGVRLTVGLDSRESLEIFSAATRAAGAAEATALVELDVGMRRTGVGDPGAAVELARRIEEDSFVEYGGVMFYPGHLRRLGSDPEEEMDRLSKTVAGFLEALEEAGLPPRIVSGGSTPTLWHSHRVAGMTEIRPGTNVFNDRNSVAAGAATWDECAYSVIATVVSTAVPGQAVIDAGSKALAAETPLDGLTGFGALLDRPEVTVRSLSEEHGVLELAGSEWRPRVGDRVRVVPNHVCVSVNLQERLWAIRSNGAMEEWTVEARGR